jgi:starch-binding outer membrane protein, SusD/RagB family
VLYSGGLSDELLFDTRVGSGGLVIYEDVDQALTIDRANTTLTGAHNRLGRLRFLADDLVRRTREITFANDTTRRRMLFTGYFYGGVARYFYASYIGLNKQQGGGTIDNGAFIPSAVMYDSALAKLNLALQNATTPADTRLVNTLLARIHLLNSRFAEAQGFAQNGLRRGDAPVRALYSVQLINQVWNNAGLGRSVYIPARRFDSTYLRQEPTDTARIKLRGPTVRMGFTYFVQIKYPLQDSPIPFATWQENDLMLAECDVRLANNSASALSRINTLRASYQGLRALPATTIIDTELLYIERDKELFCTGMRLLDQRRYNRWHLRPDTWRYLPIPLAEINNNPNLPPLVRD